MTARITIAGKHLTIESDGLVDEYDFEDVDDLVRKLNADGYQAERIS